MPKRQTWERYFMDMAILVSSRGTCNRKQVGCIIVKDNRVLSTGYNGSMPNQDHCDEVGHLMSNGGCIRTNHAEASAIAHAAKVGVSIEDSTLYCTMSPCYTCAKLIIISGIKEVVYLEEYRESNSKNLFYKSNIKCMKINL